MLLLLYVSIEFPIETALITGCGSRYDHSRDKNHENPGIQENRYVFFYF